MSGAGTPLERIIRQQITTSGGLAVAEYMKQCLTHPEHGYYTTRQPLGAEGDFLTAPEASQMFGELLGIWALACWQQLGTPHRLHIVELGPGRGLLMADLLRAARSRPAFLQALQVHLVELSPTLRREQKQRLSGFGTPLHWHDMLPEQLDASTLVIANEFFDALPVHHYERTAEGWRERLITLDANGNFTFSASGPAPATLPGWAQDLPTGSIIELSPEREAAALALGRLLHGTGGAALIIDYGHTTPAPGETLQALHRHKQVDIFHRPGECDLTTHVDFHALAEALRQAGLHTPPAMEQGAFLLALGLRERLATLLRNADDEQARRLLRGAERIAGIEHMGSLFKVLCAHHPHLPTPPPFASAGTAP